VDNILEFEMKGGDVMVLKFFVKTDKDGNEINSWYLFGTSSYCAILWSTII